MRYFLWDAIGILYLFGELGLDQSYKKAHNWFRKAAEQGYAEAQYSLGDLYYRRRDGKQEKQNYTEAFKWFKKAAEQGSAWAQYGIAELYRNGFGVSQDSKEASKWYQKAADQGNIPAKWKLQGIEWVDHEEIDKIPNRLEANPPIYPLQFRKDGIEGWVRLMILIDERGKVIKAEVNESSNKEFERPSIEAVLQWIFEPGILNGKAVRISRIQPFSFKLN